MHNLKDILINKISIKSFTPISGIYFLIDNNEIVYIGRSSDIMERIRIHLRNINKSFTHYHIIHSSFKTIEKEWLEGELIITFKPKYNSSLPPSLPFKSIKAIKKEITFHGLKRLIKKIESYKIKIYNFKNNLFLHILDISTLLSFLDKDKLCPKKNKNKE